MILIQVKIQCSLLRADLRLSGLHGHIIRISKSLPDTVRLCCGPLLTMVQVALVLPSHDIVTLGILGCDRDILKPAHGSRYIDMPLTVA